MSDKAIPEGFELARTTPEFDEHNAPPALLNAHQVAAGVWGRLVVNEGSLKFVFEDQGEEPHLLSSGESMVIPPQRPHRVVITGPTRFAVEFYRTPTTAQ